jgi:hypothetical protein
LSSASKWAAALPALVVMAIAPAAASADWHEPVAGASPINASPTRNADAPSLALIDGIPYVAWNEDTTQSGQGNSSTIQVAQLAPNGQSWNLVGESNNPPISLLSTTSSDNPSLANVQGTPWIAWQEGVSQQDVEIRVAHLADGAWTEVPPTSTINHPINHDRSASDGGGMASSPTLVDDGTGHPFVSFYELDPYSGSGPQSMFASGESPAQVWVDQLNSTGDGWNEVGGGSVNADPASDAALPHMTVINGVPWVVYYQIVPGNSGPSLDIDAAYLNSAGNAWVQVGPIASGGFNEFNATAIANVGGTPYVAISETSNNAAAVSVFSYSGGSWNLVGGGPASGTGTSAYSPSIAEINGEPWVAWQSGSGSSPNSSASQAAYLSNGSWQQAGTEANDNQDHPDTSVSLASVNGIPWMALIEQDETVAGSNSGPACCGQVRVSRLEPTFTSEDVGASDTAATLLTQVQTFGLAYPVGFRWGPSGSLANTTPTSNTSGSSAFVTATITGLQPSSLYTYAPYATAGTPEPLVEGPENAFVTTPAPSQPGPQSQSAQTTPLFALIISLTGAVRQGHSIQLRYFVSAPSNLALFIRRNGQVVATLRWKATAGTHVISWKPKVNGKTAPTGGYGVRLIAASASLSAVDNDGFRILHPLKVVHGHR